MKVDRRQVVTCLAASLVVSLSGREAGAQQSAPEQVRDFFNQRLSQYIAANAAAFLQRANLGQVQFNISGAGNWVIDFTAPATRGGSADDPTTTISVTPEDFLAALNGGSPVVMRLFMTHRMSVQPATSANHLAPIFTTIHGAAAAHD